MPAPQKTWNGPDIADVCVCERQSSKEHTKRLSKNTLCHQRSNDDKLSLIEPKDGSRNVSVGAFSELRVVFPSLPISCLLFFFFRFVLLLQGNAALCMSIWQYRNFREEEDVEKTPERVRCNCC